jgi:superfamily I DNA and/or RNA helicase
VQKFYPNKLHLLNTQYRMHPDILRFPNQAFYGSRIQSDKSLVDREPKVRFPVKFVDVADMSVEEREQTSWRNQYEAASIKHLLVNNEDILTVLHSATSPRIIVITPYQAQVQLLRKELKKFKKFQSNVDISTVDNFQGQEADVVIVSTVRTTRAAFLDANRVNVALTRAKLVLRIVGDSSLFAKLTLSPLKQLLDYARHHGLLFQSTIEAAWSKADWTIIRSWQPTMTEKFRHCLKEMTKIDKNIAFNTLLTVVTPDFKKLSKEPSSGGPKWQLSGLKE